MLTTQKRLIKVGMGVVAGLSAMLIIGCKPSQILKVPPPAGLQANLIGTQSGAEQVFTGERGLIYASFAGNLLQWSELLSDDFTWAYFKYASSEANMDARRTATSGQFAEAGDYPIEQLLNSRSGMLVAMDGLRNFPADQAKLGEGYALVGYTEVLMAEDYCAGVPLSQAKQGGGVEYGQALTTDSLLAVAVAHFDSALSNTAGSAAVQDFASVGLARAQMDLGDYAAAATAVSGVATNFVYNAELQPNYNSGPPYQLNIYAQSLLGCASMNVSDVEGGNGLNYVSAQDPRLVFDTTITHTCDQAYGGVSGSWYYPKKFGDPSSTFVPMATGIEARLDEAEAALAGGSPSTWLADLNALRTNGTMTVDTLPGPVIDTVWGLGTGQVSGQTTGLRPLTDPGSTGAEVALMFRERAFWLFGTGTRLGDMRRLVRQYQVPLESVYPTGAYATSDTLQGFLHTSGLALTSYGTDASITLPTLAGNGNSQPTGNPHYVGCLTSTSDP